MSCVLEGGASEGRKTICKVLCQHLTSLALILDYMHSPILVLYILMLVNVNAKLYLVLINV